MLLPYELHDVLCPVCKSHLPASLICSGFSFPVGRAPQGDRLEVFLCPDCSATFAGCEGPEDRGVFIQAMLTNTNQLPHLLWTVTTQRVIEEHDGYVLAAIVEGRKMSDEEYAVILFGKDANNNDSIQS